MRVDLLAAILIGVAAGSAGAQPSKINPLPYGAGAAAGTRIQPAPASLTVEVPLLETIQAANARVSALEPQARVAALKVKAARIEPIKSVNAEPAKIELDRAAARPITSADVALLEIDAPTTTAPNVASADTQPRKMTPSLSLVQPIVYVSLQPSKMSPGIAGLTGIMRYINSPWLDHAINDLGTNPTGWKRVWCARSLNMWLQMSGKRGCGSNSAISCLEAGRRLEGPQVGAIAVLKHHVGIVKEIEDRHVVLVSGNNRGRPGARTVGVGKYARANIVGYVWPE